MTSMTITMAILTHPLQILLAGVVLVYAARAALSASSKASERRRRERVPAVPAITRQAA